MEHLARNCARKRLAYHNLKVNCKLSPSDARKRATGCRTVEQACFGRRPSKSAQKCDKVITERCRPRENVAVEGLQRLHREIRQNNCGLNDVSRQRLSCRHGFLNRSARTNSLGGRRLRRHSARHMCPLISMEVANVKKVTLSQRRKAFALGRTDRKICGDRATQDEAGGPGLG